MTTLCLIWLLSVLVSSALANLTVLVTTTEPKGIKFSIEDRGYTTISLHSTVNRIMVGADTGDINVELKNPIDNKFIYENMSVLLTPGDIVHYWVETTLKDTGKVEKHLNMSYNYTGNTCVGSKCQYSCNCYKKKCLPDKSGLCYPEFHCEEKYFGFACQYVNLCIGVKQEIPAFHDQNISTCYDGSLKKASLNMEPARFTFLQLVFRNSPNLSILNAIQIALYRNGTNIPCVRWSYVPVEFEDSTVQFHCLNSTEEVDTVLITGDDVLPLICEALISGGRNVAFMASVSMTSTLRPGYDAKYAVDGKYGNGFKENECIHSDVVSSSSPTLTITFDSPYYILNYIIIRNKPTSGIQEFYLTTFDEKGVLVYRYNDMSSTPKAVYKIRHETMDRVMQLKLTQPGINSNLTICEIEAYGDCPVGFHGLSCINICSPGCVNKMCNLQGNCIECGNNRFGVNCDKDCSSCPSNGSFTCRRIDGYCLMNCPTGKYGLSCNNVCNKNCGGNGSCHQNTGACTYGCKEGFEGIMCKDVKDKNFKGCSPNCGGDGGCDKKTGVCTHGCKKNVYGVECQEANHKGDASKEICFRNGTCVPSCPDGMYGANCSMECSKTCGWSKACHPETGKCTEGCVRGYGGDFCKTDCSYCNHGLCHRELLTCTMGCKQGSTHPLCSRAQTGEEKQSSEDLTIYIAILIFFGSALFAVVYQACKTKTAPVQEARQDDYAAE